MDFVVTKNKTDPCAEKLHSAGLRSTGPRRAVLNELQKGGHHAAANIYESIKADLPGTSLQAVYIVLNDLTKAGVTRKIETGSGVAALYETRVGDNHHHLVCTSCGQIEDVACVVGEAPCLTPSDTHGFAIATADVVFTGICASCQNNQT